MCNFTQYNIDVETQCDSSKTNLESGFRFVMVINSFYITLRYPTSTCECSFSIQV